MASVPAQSDDASALYLVLASNRRRRVLEALQEVSHPMDLDKLARVVTDRERESVEPTADPELLRRCEVELHHNHLPMLADAGLVAYDRSDRTVTLMESSLPPEITRHSE